MAKSVNGAFSTFNRDYINLDSDRTKIARTSRDWLYGQLNSLPTNNDSFPLSYEERHVKFGSFARNTKIRELDDIDLIFCLHANDAYYSQSAFGKTFYLNTTNAGQRLKNLSDDNSQLNSIKVVNKFVSSLSAIGNYKSAEIHRRQEAATLNLVSYEWNFDIVPAFYTDKGFYLIPDGAGNWKATNPPLDQEYISRVNQKHDQSVHQLVRTLKYWNRYAKMPTMSSYLFEVMIVDYCDRKNELSKYLDVNLINFWHYLQSKIYHSIHDPKKIELDLNTLSYDDKIKVSEKAKDAYSKGYEAYRLETEEKDQNASINKWREIFGNNFPVYE